MKLPEWNIRDAIVPEPEQDLLKVAVLVMPKLSPRGPFAEYRPGSILPWRQVSRAGRFAGAAADRVVSLNQTIRFHRPKESDGAIVSLDFKVHRRAHDEAGRGKGPLFDRPRIKAGITESESSGETKAALRGGAALS
jgi:hypothetical protein